LLRAAALAASSHQAFPPLPRIPNESIVDVQGTLVKVEKPTACTQSDVELHLERVYVISASDALPFQIEDAMNPEPRVSAGRVRSRTGAARYDAACRLRRRARRRPRTTRSSCASPRASTTAGLISE
jgi:aspartyl-tRNA synthetase